LSHATPIRSNTMSHITLKMCQFVLIVHLRDYHNNVMVLLWCSSTYLYYISKFMSDWSLFRTTSHNPRHQSHLDCIIRIDISDYPGIFSHFPHVLDSITIRFTMFGATQKIKNQRRKKECSEYFFNTKT
jgi:hypothetical protein